MEDTQEVDDQTPDPLETVTVLKSDLEAQNMAMAMACADVDRIARACGLVYPPGTPPAAMVQAIVSTVQAMHRTQTEVDRASEDLRRRAGMPDAVTIDLPDGRRAVRVGVRDNSLVTGLQPMTRRERRDFERKRRS